MNRSIKTVLFTSVICCAVFNANAWMGIVTQEAEPSDYTTITDVNERFRTAMMWDNLAEIKNAINAGATINKNQELERLTRIIQSMNERLATFDDPATIQKRKNSLNRMITSMEKRLANFDDPAKIQEQKTKLNQMITSMQTELANLNDPAKRAEQKKKLQGKITELQTRLTDLDDPAKRQEQKKNFQEEIAKKQAIKDYFEAETEVAETEAVEETTEEEVAK